MSITATCTCGRHTYHEHDAEEESWVGPSAWFSKHPIDEAPEGTYCSTCGDLLLEGGATETRAALAAERDALREQVAGLRKALEWVREQNVHVYPYPFASMQATVQAPPQSRDVFAQALAAATNVPLSTLTGEAEPGTVALTAPVTCESPMRLTYDLATDEIISLEPTGTDIPHLFEVPPIDITGGADAADFVQEQREGEATDGESE